MSPPPNQSKSRNKAKIEKELAKQARPQHFPAPDDDISLEEFNRAIIEAASATASTSPKRSKNRSMLRKQTQPAAQQ